MALFVPHPVSVRAVINGRAGVTAADGAGRGSCCLYGVGGWSWSPDSQSADGIIPDNTSSRFLSVDVSDVFFIGSSALGFVVGQP